MAKYIKRAGIVFFVLVLSLLLAVGTMCVTGVVEKNSNSIVNTNSQNNTLAENNNSNSDSGVKMPSKESAVIPASDTEFVLNCACPDSEPCSCGKMAEIWSNALTYSRSKSVVVKVTLAKNWIANSTNNSFGDMFGFYNGGIDVPYNTNIILDLNGKKIDRNLQTMTGNGYVIFLSGTLSIMDNKYDNEIVKDITTLEEIENLPFGRITGGKNNSSFVSGTTAPAGGISMNKKSQLNFYGGMIISNNSNSVGGGISSLEYSVINIYDGIIAGNEGSSGGLQSRCGSINLYGGYILHNVGHSGGGVSCYGNYTSTGLIGYINIYGGVIARNFSHNFGGGITTHDNAVLKMYDGEIVDNVSVNDSGGVLVGQWSTFDMYGGKISRNSVERVFVNNNNGGGGIIIVSNSTMTLYDGEISYNKVESKDTKAVAGGGILVTGSGGLNLKGGVIKGNQVLWNEGKALGGGICARDKDVLLNVGGGTQVYDNTANGKDSDIYLVNESKIGIDGLLGDHYQIAHVGIDLDTAYGEKSFTHGYSNSRNRYIAPSRYFFANGDNKVIDVNVTDSEVMVKDGTKVTNKVVWSWTGAASGTSDQTNAAVVYAGDISLSCLYNGSKVDFYRQGMTSKFQDYTYINNAGNYAFYTNTSCKNDVFTLTILPKQVDVLWKEDSFVYNGSSQKPIAYIEEDANCKVITTGEQISSGNNYIASAIELSNKNYKINNSTMNKTFSIAKAKLNKPSGEINFEYDGDEKEFLPTGFDSKTMNLTGNTATNVGSYTAAISIKDKHNYMWQDGSNVDIILNYSITLTPQVEENNSVYKFIYIDDEGYRKTYSEGNITHGVNDSGLNGGRLVLGNISPNTSVKRFVETLGYDTSKIVIKDKAGKEIYVNGVPVDQSTYDKRFELAVGTGWSVEYTTTGGTEIIYLSVLGDINGDGRISASDCAYLREIANDKALYDNLNAEIKLASLIINKGKVTSADSEIVLNVINQKLTMDLFF